MTPTQTTTTIRGDGHTAVVVSTVSDVDGELADQMHQSTCTCGYWATEVSDNYGIVAAASAHLPSERMRCCMC